MTDIKNILKDNLAEIRNTGLFKEERIIQSQQRADIQVNDENVLNFCANNYLGLANHPELISAAQKGLEQWGFGLSSVRFICGTQEIHKELEKNISQFLLVTVLYLVHQTLTKECLYR